jgi:hypothetical protein
VDTEGDAERVAECDRGVAGEYAGVLRLVPVSSELIRSADDEQVPVKCERLCGLEPSPKRLFRKFLSRAIEETRPDFARVEGHGTWMWKTRGEAKVLGPGSEVNSDS